MDMWPVESLVAAAQWGADQELEACCEWLEHKVLLQHQHDVVLSLRAARRPKPPSLKEQALEALEAHFAALQAGEPTYRPSYKAVIRRALEALPDD
jgi:acyl carrier protein phosphodiesterase